MINLDQTRPVQQPATQQQLGAGALFQQTQPQPRLPIGQAAAASGQPAAALGRGQSSWQGQTPKPMNALERFQIEQARLQELLGIINQAQAKLDSVRSAMGKGPKVNTRYEDAVKG